MLLRAGRTEIFDPLVCNLPRCPVRKAAVYWPEPNFSLLSVIFFGAISFRRRSVLRVFPFLQIGQQWHRDAWTLRRSEQPTHVKELVAGQDALQTNDSTRHSFKTLSEIQRHHGDCYAIQERR